ncbi:phosphate/phosphite/phosphonate ABC transporter substrate-binding protein [Maledivibacter halophilus]|uniref:Phosphonate transport system substrate-binding protein n=1 Tax=Maledivibacter halophilus TaxID=36842 RepID=A0A1T5J9E5_9FIRM|nr:phosphate/phosphite/phosphonate ABC transporter substrate-binding protein [Maledivibacter halophilus]SKC47882.1 phosphonate transport system substrate-binding protein [Maledivibacter halophilus]
MKKIFSLLVAITLLTTIFTGCSSSTEKAGKDYDTITMVWYPNESGDDLKSARDEFAKVIEEATGKKVEHKLTTDYAITIETLVNGNAHISWLGAQGYIEAHNKNDKVLPVVVNSGKSGTLEDAVYYSWLSVQKGNEDQYKLGDEFSIDNIQGKKFSFVSNSSTSGFKVPSAGIISYFSKKSNWKNISKEDLLEGGDDKFFKEVLFGGSHQGSAVNLLTGKADIAAFCDSCVANYVELIDGTANRPGAVYKVKDNAAEPFNTIPGEEFTLISVTPVLNAPFAMNSEVLSVEDQKAIIEALTSDKVPNNEKIFVPEGSNFKGLFDKDGDSRFLKVEDSWFDPVRELSK